MRSAEGNPSRIRAETHVPGMFRAFKPFPSVRISGRFSVKTMVSSCFRRSYPLVRHSPTVTFIKKLSIRWITTAAVAKGYSDALVRRRSWVRFPSAAPCYLYPDPIPAHPSSQGPFHIGALGRNSMRKGRGVPRIIVSACCTARIRTRSWGRSMWSSWACACRPSQVPRWCPGWGRSV